MLREPGHQPSTPFRRRMISFFALSGLLAAPSLATAQIDVSDVPAPVRRLNPGITEYGNQYSDQYSNQYHGGQSYSSNYGQPRGWHHSGYNSSPQYHYVGRHSYSRGNCCGGTQSAYYGGSSYGGTVYSGSTQPYYSNSYSSQTVQPCCGGTVQGSSMGYYSGQQNSYGYGSAQAYQGVQPYGMGGMSGGMSGMNQSNNRARLGIAMQDSDQGVRITQVMDNSAAMDAGLQQGDVLVRINDQSVNGWQQVQQRIGTMQAGDNVQLTVLRDGEEQQIQATLDQPQQTYQSARPSLDGSQQSGFSGNVNSQVQQLQREVQMLKQELQRVKQEVGIGGSSNNLNQPGSTRSNASTQGNISAQGNANAQGNTNAQGNAGNTSDAPNAGIDANVDSASDLDSPGADASINGDANAGGNLPSPAGNAGGGVEAGGL